MDTDFWSSRETGANITTHNTPLTMTHIPLCDLSGQFAPIREEIRQSIDAVLDSQQFIMGPQVRELEKQIAKYCQTPHAVGCSSGSDALLLALMALDIGPGDEVLTSPFTFFATAGAIARLGATPVFVDINPQDYNIDTGLIESAITANTRAIIPVHLFGQMADMDTIMDIARQHDLYVIEDAAQSIGAEYQGRRAGSFGNAGCFSFFPSKNLGGLGDGGMVTTNDEELANKMRILRSHGANPKYHHALIGGNFRLDTIQAAALVIKLRHLDSWNQSRQDVAARYQSLFAERNSQLGIGLPLTKAHYTHVYNQYVVNLGNRNQTQQFLTERGVGTGVYYPQPLHLQECFAYLGYQTGDLPVSEAACDRVLALPMFPALARADQEIVVTTLTELTDVKTSVGTPL